MKQWRVYAQAKPGQGPGIIIHWPEWDEHEAKRWFKEHQTDKPGHFYFGMTLELVEFETREERIEKALETIQGIGSKSAMISAEEGLSRAIKIATQALAR